MPINLSIDHPVFMREVAAPHLTPALEKAASKWIQDTAGLQSRPQPLAELRAAAFAALQKIGLPHSGSEDFTFLRVGELLPHYGPPVNTLEKSVLAKKPLALPSLESIQAFIYPECRECYAVIVDGIYVPSLSQPGSNFNIKPWQGEQTDALITVLSNENDAAAALSPLFAVAPVYVEIGAKCTATSPLQILHYRTPATAHVVSPIDDKAGSRCDAFIVVQAGKLSESRIVVRHVQAADSSAQASASMTNTHTVLLLEEAATLHFLESGIEMQSESVTVTDADAEAEIQADSKAGTLHFRKLTARLNRNSHVLAVSAHTGSRLMRHSFSIDLLGEGADAEVNGAVVLTGRRQSHNYLRIRHLVPNCTSRQHFKSVVAGSSRSSVDGTIFVAQDAQGTNANQLINNLMLSDEAHTDSKPQLMIHADDVKCTHGTTIGKLDSAQQFYLESRGLTFAQARTLMTVAFIAEILNKTGAANSASAPGGQVDNGATASFRTQLDHELLDSLKLHLPSVSGESSINHA